MVALRLLQGIFECARHFRQCLEADGGRAARQRMGQGERRVTYGSVPLHRPLGNLGDQTARPFVGLIQIDVVQRNADTQVTNDLDLFITGVIIAGQFIYIRRRKTLRFYPYSSRGFKSCFQCAGNEVQVHQTAHSRCRQLCRCRRCDKAWLRRLCVELEMGVEICNRRFQRFRFAGGVGRLCQLQLKHTVSREHRRLRQL